LPRPLPTNLGIADNILGWNPRRIAAAFGQIADRLGYQRYGVQGGDWGAIVSCNMAELRPDRVLGLHVNLMNVPPPSGERAAPPTEWARRVRAFFRQLR
jgi:microsomal epoxide hydrolase